MSSWTTSMMAPTSPSFLFTQCWTGIADSCSAFFNNITYVAPKVPTLFTALTSGDAASDSVVYGEYTHPFVLEKDQVVEIIVNNIDPGKHPFHLHGHNFQSVWRSAEEAGTFQDSGI